MRALIAGGGMAGLMTALALRESGVFTAIDVFEQTPTPSTAGAGLNIPPNGARLARWLGADLAGGDPEWDGRGARARRRGRGGGGRGGGGGGGGGGPPRGERRMIWEDNSVSRKPLDH